MVSVIAAAFASEYYTSKSRTALSYVLEITLIPLLASEVFVTLVSSLFPGEHFLYADFLKVLACFIPFIGLTLEYSKNYREKKIRFQKVEGCGIEAREYDRTEPHRGGEVGRQAERARGIGGIP